MGRIAEAAGVGRVTVYGQLSLTRGTGRGGPGQLLDDGDKVLDRVDLTGALPEVLRDLIGSSWLLMAQSGAVLEAARAVLPPGRVQEFHAKPADRVYELTETAAAQDPGSRPDPPCGGCASRWARCG